MASAAMPDRKQRLSDLGPVFEQRAAEYDRSDGFVAENYREMREARLFSAMVPEELGGGGLSYNDVCGLVRGLGRYCASTALTFSMHQHLVAAALWNHRHAKPAEKLLRTVAAGEKILVSTGATDWLASSGTLEACEGGFRLNARKPFSSGCLAGDLLITSAQYDDPKAGRQVLHFPVPMNAAGISIDRVWETMGMRGTGSHTVVLRNVFVPEQAIGLRRPRGQYHPVWNLVLTVALPLICAAYVGLAEAVLASARQGATKKGDDGFTAGLLGELENQFATAEVAFESMLATANNLEVEPTVETANRALIRKTIIAEAVKRCADKALELSGGGGYFRASGLERLVRDAYAAQFHPLPAKKQHRFTGRLAMGLDPV